jgi:hypothetical protein
VNEILSVRANISVILSIARVRLEVNVSHERTQTKTSLYVNIFRQALRLHLRTFDTSSASCPALGYVSSLPTNTLAYQLYFDSHLHTLSAFSTTTHEHLITNLTGLPPTKMSKLKPNNVIILTLFLVVIFCVLFTWYLHRSCRRAIDAEVHEMQYKKGLEAKKAPTGSDNGNASAKANAS